MSDKVIEKSRVNMYLPNDLKDWLWQEANKNGFNLTTMVQVIILDYKKQQEALEFSKLANVIRDLQIKLEHGTDDPK